jgi:hypothetical protein
VSVPGEGHEHIRQREQHSGADKHGHGGSPSEQGQPKNRKEQVFEGQRYCAAGASRPASRFNRPFQPLHDPQKAADALPLPSAQLSYRRLRLSPHPPLHREITEEVADLRLVNASPRACCEAATRAVPLIIRMASARGLKSAGLEEK